MRSLRDTLRGRAARLVLAAALAVALAPAVLGGGGVGAAGDASNELSVSGFSRAPATIEAGQINAALLALTVTVSGGVATLDHVTVLRTGTAADADVAPDGVRLWWDANGNGFIDGVDRQLDSSEFSGGAVSLRAQQSVWAFQPIQLLVSVTPAENATPGATLGLTIDGPARITATAGTTIGGGIPDHLDPGHDRRPAGERVRGRGLGQRGRHGAPDDHRQ